MILVLCLNAAVDKTVSVSRLSPGRRNRIASFLALPGGKGVNVARALRSLGEHPFLLGFTAGHSGRFIEDGVRRERIAARWIRLQAGESRTCLSILDGEGDPTEFNEPGPVVRAGDFKRLEKAYRALLPKAGIVVLSGSLPLGLAPATYARLIAPARRSGKIVFLDTSAPALGPALRAGPDLVKLNREETASLDLPTGKADLARTLARLLRRGAREAVITLGSEGAVLAAPGLRLSVQAPAVPITTPIGCGDTFLAALAHARLRGWPKARSLAFAAALATASAKVPGAGVFRKRDIPRVLAGVKMRELR